MSPTTNTSPMNADKDAARARLLKQTLQKFGYDLEDCDGVESPTSADATLSPTDLSQRRRGSLCSSASILQLRERKNLQSAFHIAVRKGHLDVLKALARLPRAEEHVNTGDRHANTPLHFAASSARDNAAEMVELLFSIGASPAAVNVRGQTPLAIHIMTVRRDDPTITKLFLKKERVLGPSLTLSPRSQAASYSALNELVNGKTYLHMALERELTDIACALVAADACVNIPDEKGLAVSDMVPKKTLVKLICHMNEGPQAPPADITRVCCKLCSKAPRGLLESLKDCNLCGRAVCKLCSKKAAEVRAESLREKDVGRLCNVCCTVLQLRAEQHRQRVGFNQKLYGMGMH